MAVQLHLELPSAFLELLSSYSAVVSVSWIRLLNLSLLGPAGFKPLFMLHNFLLSAGSGIVLALMVEEVSSTSRSPNRNARSRRLLPFFVPVFRSFPSSTSTESSTPSATMAPGLPGSRPTTSSTTS